MAAASMFWTTPPARKLTLVEWVTKALVTIKFAPVSS